MRTMKRWGDLIDEHNHYEHFCFMTNKGNYNRSNVLYSKFKIQKTHLENNMNQILI